MLINFTSRNFKINLCARKLIFPVNNHKIQVDLFNYVLYDNCVRISYIPRVYLLETFCQHLFQMFIQVYFGGTMKNHSKKHSLWEDHKECSGFWRRGMVLYRHRIIGPYLALPLALWSTDHRHVKLTADPEWMFF